MHESDDLDWILLDRYAAGEATAAEVAQVERWLAGNAARGALLDAMRTRTDHAAWDTRKAWASVRGQTGLSPAQQRATGRWQGASGLLRAAAVFVVLGGAALIGRALLQSDDAGAVQMLSAVTARSESDTIRLDDGSEIILAPASQLDYPRTFAATSREVRLTGEALFRVASDASRPFTVHAGHATVRVVGTQFITRTPAAAAPDGEVAVAVVEGAVAVRSSSGEVMVRPGQVAHVRADGTHTVATTDLDVYVAWTEGRLVFDDAPISDVFAELERWYPLAFRADGDLNTRRVTARFRAGSVDETVAALALALGATHRRSNDTITFTTK